jgi:hypothetical protein
MLRHDVVAAVETGHFAIYAVDHIDDALSLLTELGLGAAQADGSYPRDTFNGQVEERLLVLCERAQEFGAGATGNGADVGASARALRWQLARP